MNWGEIPEGRGGLPDRPPMLAQCTVAAPLVGRAQWETNSGHPPEKDTSERGWSIISRRCSSGLMVHLGAFQDEQVKYRAYVRNYT